MLASPPCSSGDNLADRWVAASKTANQLWLSRRCLLLMPPPPACVPHTQPGAHPCTATHPLTCLAHWHAVAAQEPSNRAPYGSFSKSSRLEKGMSSPTGQSSWQVSCRLGGIWSVGQTVRTMHHVGACLPAWHVRTLCWRTLPLPLEARHVRLCRRCSEARLAGSHQPVAARHHQCWSGGHDYKFQRVRMGGAEHALTAAPISAVILRLLPRPAAASLLMANAADAPRALPTLLPCCSSGRYEGHFSDRGYNAINMQYVANAWVRRTTILNADNNIFLARAEFTKIAGGPGGRCRGSVQLGQQSWPTHRARARDRAPQADQHRWQGCCPSLAGPRHGLVLCCRRCRVRNWRQDHCGRKEHERAQGHPAEVQLPKRAYDQASRPACLCACNKSTACLPAFSRHGLPLPLQVQHREPLLSRHSNREL